MQMSEASMDRRKHANPADYKTQELWITQVIFGFYIYDSHPSQKFQKKDSGENSGVAC